MLQTIKMAGSVLTALASAATAGTNALADAGSIQQRIIGYLGDINGSGTVESADVSLLQNFLFRQADLPEEQMPFTDMDHSGGINAKDLTILKQILVNQKEPEPVYGFTETDKALIPAPVTDIEPDMPSVGEVSILAVAVNFPDRAHDKNMSAEDIHELIFGDAKPNDYIHPLESITAYYDRASYGRLHLTGDVYIYTAQRPIDYYLDKTDLLVAEVLTGLDAQINYKKYDANDDAAMDTLLLALPGQPRTDYWWPCSGDSTLHQYFDGVCPGNLCIGAWPLSDLSGFNSTWVHELGHAMGLPDYYVYPQKDEYGNEEELSPEEYYGLNGDAGTEMMDDAFGDMCAFSKLMLGWYKTDEVQIYTGGTKTFTLDSSQHSPGCILIPREDLNDPRTDLFHSEFFLIESVTNDENNAAGFYENSRYPLFRSGGVRIMHCDSELWDGYWGPEFKWNNYGQLYDSSNKKQRVLRLVNEGGGFFRAGAQVSFGTQGFGWYSSSGNVSVDPGIIITVNSLDSDGHCTITVSQDH